MQYKRDSHTQLDSASAQLHLTTDIPGHHINDLFGSSIAYTENYAK